MWTSSTGAPQWWNSSVDHSWHPEWTAQPSHDLHTSRNSLQGPTWDTNRPSWETNEHKRASQDLHNGENYFLNNFWYSNWREQYLKDHHSGGNGFQYLSWHANCPSRALQNFYSCKTCILDLCRHWNWREQASLGLNDLTGLPQWRKLLCCCSEEDSQDNHSGKNGFLYLSQHADWQHAFWIFPNTETGVNKLH